eukprot:jgi/Galph1/4861/GphlegSOOS_G3508.1
MKAVVVQQFGPPAEALKPKEIPIPPVGKQLEHSQIRVQVKAAGVNPVDAKISRGLLSLVLRKIKPPYVPGIDFAGVVDGVGSQVRLFKKGDAVFGMACLGWGSYAEYCIAQESDVHQIPKNITFEQAAALPVVALTAYCGLVHYAHIHGGERVLVVGGSGGVGSQAVQIAKLLGASFVGGVCSERNVSFVQELGADKVYNYQSTGIIEIVQDCKPDILFDAIGIDEYWTAACQLMAPRTGRFVCVVPPGGSSYEHALSWRTLLNTSISVINRKAQYWLSRAPAYSVIIQLEPAHLREIASWVDESKLKIFIEQVYPMDQVVQAHERLETGRVVGKLVLK